MKTPRFARWWAATVILLTLAMPATAQDITVTAANPATAEQGVTLDVEISGSGFKKGARAAFLITGTSNPGGIIVNSTAFVNPNKLVANITVAPDAQTELKFDIAVTSGGRTGKGIELFGVLKVEAQTDIPVNSRLADGAGYTIQSDGSGWYFDRTSGVSSVVFSGSGDWQLDMLGSRTRRVLIILNPVNGDPTGRPFQAALVPARFMTCNAPDPAETDSFWDALPGGAAEECNLRLRFTYNRKEYVLHMNGSNGTSRATVVCTTSGGSTCSSWVSSMGTAESPGVGMLQVVDKAGAVNDIGLYFVSYSAEVVRP